MASDTVATLVPPVNSFDHHQGSETARLTLVEYGDFECPHCGRAHPLVKRLQQQLGSDLRVIFRHFPLTKIHAHAELAAEAAEAAAAAGRFWEMHDVLFKNQRALAGEDLARYADSMGLDSRRFSRELADHLYESKVREDFRSGVRSGVNGTPTFFINGMRYEGDWEFGGLLTALREALQRSRF